MSLCDTVAQAYDWNAVDSMGYFDYPIKGIVQQDGRIGDFVNVEKGSG